MRTTLSTRPVPLACLLAGCAVLVTLTLAHAARAQTATEPLKLVATIPDLGDIARTIGGDQVAVAVLAKPTEDPHFIEAKPSFVKLLNDADVLLLVGLDQEVGYLPPLLLNARNERVLPGHPGYLDASRAITPLELPAAPVDRSMGDVHPYGNPHYWLDPLNGIRIAAAIRDTLATLRPDQKVQFDTRMAAFTERIHTALVGDALARKYDAAKLALLFEYGKLLAFLKEQGDAGLLGGWLGILAPHAGAKAVDDHNLWPYFTRRFGLLVIGHMEPKPGIPPTTSHLADLVERMRSEQVHLILASPYYDVRHARFLADATGAAIVPLATLVGSRPDTPDYLATVDYNVRQVARALGKAGL